MESGHCNNDDVTEIFAAGIQAQRSPLAVRTVQSRENGGYFRNQSSTLQFAFHHGSRQAQSVPHSLSGMVVAFEFRELELVGRIVGQHLLTWFAVTKAS